MRRKNHRTLEQASDPDASKVPVQNSWWQEEIGIDLPTLIESISKGAKKDGDNLEPISPEKARSRYIGEREEDASYETLQTVSDSTEEFVEWTETVGIENMNEISGRKLSDFKQWCKNESENNKVSLNGILSNIRRFLVYCVTIEAVGSEIPDKTPIPNVPDDQEVCYEKPSDDEVEATLEYLRSYEYGSRRHVAYELIAEIGNRMGAARGIDEKDIKNEEPAVQFRHRPERSHPDERGTPLKNGTDGQRDANIPSDLMELIQAYLDNPDRYDTEDKFGRKPLFTTASGRVTLSTFRRDFYKLTRPCVYSDSCPHDRDQDTCEATNNNTASECPSSYSPHPLRRWSIERQIDHGIPKEKLSDRVDVSVPVLNKHYDTRSEERQQEQRLKLLEKLFPNYGDPDSTIDADLFEEDILDKPRSTLAVDVAESAMADREEQNPGDSSLRDGETKSHDSVTEDEEVDESALLNPRTA